jgi:high affinity Mn2+ porin
VNSARKSSVVALALFAITGVKGASAEDDSCRGFAGEAHDACLSWRGAYVGAHAGPAFGFSHWNGAPGLPASGTSELLGHDGQTRPLVGGFQAGYNSFLAPHWLLGVEADVTFPNNMFSNQNGADGTVTADQVDAYARLRGRLGYAFGPWLVYAAAGGAVTREEISIQGAAADLNYLTRWGFSAGLGGELRLSPEWSAQLQYSLDLFERSHLVFANAGASYGSDLTLHSVTLGLNYHFGADEKAPSFFSNMSNWSIHGQTTAVYQASLPFHAPYSGAQSLGPGFIARDTISTTGFLGYRIYPGLELYFNPEPFQGFGLAGTHGLGGFSNGEAQKGGFAFPHYNTSRLFLRETSGFGGEQEDLDDGQNQFGGRVDVSRLTLTAGRMSSPDIFDQNAYAHDPRGQFMNWVFMDAGAFDFGGDQKGYTWGAALELNQKNWAARIGYFLEPTMPNGNDFDTSFGKGQTIAELEGRYALFDRPGKLRIAGWWDDAVSGNFNLALATVGAANIQQTWTHRTEYGFYINAEQAVTDSVGLFSRLSWRSGQTQMIQFADIDQSASFGLSLKGMLWRRPQDTAGFAAAINGISPAFRNYLAAGGMGLNIGDGALDYNGEKILESYYAIGLTSWSSLMFDYQFVSSPAYNAQRGPANIVSARLHSQF